MLKNIESILKIGGFPAICFAGIYYSTGDFVLSSLAAIIGFIVAYFAGFIWLVLDDYRKGRAETLLKALEAQRGEFLRFGIFGSWKLRRYQTYVLYKFRTFDTKGFTTQGAYTLDLHKVFVQLSILPDDKSSEDSPANHHTMRDIWHYIASKEPRLRDVAIIGSPGSGKTTLLKYLALYLCGHTNNRKKHRLLPVLLMLRDHAHTIMDSINAGQSLRLSDIVNKELEKNLPITIPPDWIVAQLNAKHCLVMFDGLDEVADISMREHIVRWVEQQMQIYGGNRFVVSSRPHGYDTNPIQGLTRLKVEDFNRIQQEQFVHNWYLSNEIMSQQRNDKGVENDAEKGASDLLKRIRGNEALSRMAINPLLLTLIATVHRYSSELPGRRVDLYAEICLVFLGKRRQVITEKARLAPLQKKIVLQQLAFEMMKREIREIDADEASEIIRLQVEQVSKGQMQVAAFLQEIVNETGLLIEREVGVLGFSHLTLQEYLAACHIKEWEALLDSLTAQIHNSWWRECIRLYCAQTDATGIVQACIEAIQADYSDTAPFTLGVECLAESLTIQPEIAQAFDEMIKKGVENDQPEIAKYFQQGKLDLRISRMVRIEDNLYIDNGFISNAEYQLFLDAMPFYRDFCLPQGWDDGFFPAGKGDDKVNGIHLESGILFAMWLSQRDRQYQYRIPGSDDNVYLDSINHGLMLFHSGYGGGGYCALDRASDLALDLTRDLARALASDLALDLVHDLARARDRASDLASALDRASDRTLVRVRVLASTRVRVRDIDLTLASARDFARDLVRASALELFRASDLASALDRARDLTSALASALDRALDRASALDRARDRALANALASDLARDLTSALTLASDRASTLALALDLASARDLDQARDLARVLARDSARELDLNQARDLARNLDLASDRASTLARDLDLASASDFDRALDLALDRDFDRELDLIRITYVAMPVLIELLQSEKTNALKLEQSRIVAIYFIVHVAQNRGWFDMSQPEFERYTAALEAMHKASSGALPVSPENTDKGIRLIREFPSHVE